MYNFVLICMKKRHFYVRNVRIWYGILCTELYGLKKILYGICTEFFWKVCGHPEVFMIQSNLEKKIEFYFGSETLLNTALTFFPVNARILYHVLYNLHPDFFMRTCSDMNKRSRQFRLNAIQVCSDMNKRNRQCRLNVVQVYSDMKKGNRH